MPETYKVWAMCDHCRGWQLIGALKKNYGNATKNVKCESCGHIRFDPQSVISERTYDPDRAKAKSRRKK